MYHSLSKLLQETQAAAAKKLGVLENMIDEDYLCQDGLTEQLQDVQSRQRFEGEEANVPHASNERLTLWEHQIW